MPTNRQINAHELGIDLSSKKETSLFRWLLACLLFGKPIQQEVARNAYQTITATGVTSVNKLIKTDWDKLVKLLDDAHYARYDFSTATKLLQVFKSLKKKYGTVSRLIKQSEDIADLESRLLAFKGVGPVTARIFMRDITPIWFQEATHHEYDSADRAARILNKHGFEAYIIGGAVRDLWLGRKPKDFDIATDARPEQIMNISEFTRSKHTDGAQAFGVTRVKIGPLDNSHEVEIATFRRDIEAHKGRKQTRVEFTSLEEDVLRRDFTINALALDPHSGQIIDLVDGVNDLHLRSIRFIGNPKIRIKEDPLRIMRAVRFKNQLRFRYHPETVKAIKYAAAHGMVEAIAVDRLRDELDKLLIHSSRAHSLQDLNTLGILIRILPEVVAGKRVHQPPQFHAEGTVWQHELLILDYLPLHPSRRLAWAALLHDIGKGPTFIKPQNPHDRIHFNRHHAVGAEMAKAVLKRLQFSHHDIKDISWLVYNHMAIDDLPNMRPSHQQRMLGNPAFEDLLELHRADAAASWQPGHTRGSKPKFTRIDKIWQAYQSKSPAQRQPSLKRDLGIDGSWLIDTFKDEYGLSEGPLIGKVLEELNNWYRDEGGNDASIYEAKARTLIATELEQLT